MEVFYEDERDILVRLDEVIYKADSENRVIWKIALNRKEEVKMSLAIRGACLKELKDSSCSPSCEYKGVTITWDGPKFKPNFNKGTPSCSLDIEE